MQVPVASGSILAQSKSRVYNSKDQIVNSVSCPSAAANTHSMELSEGCRISMNRNHTLMTSSPGVPNTRGNSAYLNTSSEESRHPTANTSWHEKDVRDGAVTTQLEDLVIAVLSICFFY